MTIVSVTVLLGTITIWKVKMKPKFLIWSLNCYPKGSGGMTLMRAENLGGKGQVSPDFLGFRLNMVS